ncbi:riboflavin kinase [Phaeobacter inhibens]|jgi:riboflavin kinase/FMN adenylyltransferase|uniref:riboflavin kinase n=1 Tax=Phaeobacter inhibens TaxID=221822 RepID=A0A2I7KG72_9RHOB|nr:riboflavin kinase [Phaeobacter inhibens]AUR01595.1 Riboflavin biosynthesis protein RibF [Phaeobacter inhibens]
MTQNEQIENSGKTTNATLPFKVSGAVSHGDKRGRLLGFPTANLVSAQIVGLAYGVYASTTRITGRSPKEFASVTSYGRRPTFETEEDLVKAMTQDVALVRSLISHKNEHNSEENWTCRPSLSLS